MSHHLAIVAAALLLAAGDEFVLDSPIAAPGGLSVGFSSGLPAALPISFPGGERLVEPKHVLRSPALARALAALCPTSVRGNLRVVHAPTSCQPAGGVNPGIRPAWREPRVGEPVHVTWTTRACVVPAPPDDFALLFLSLDGLPTPLPLAPAGCALLVRPDFIMLPSFSPNAVLRREPGRGILLLNWTPDAGLVGQSLWMQLLVFAPSENTAGYLMSPALELVIGSAP